MIVRCDGRTYLGIQLGDVSPVKELLTGGIRLEGTKELFLAFPRLFPMAPSQGTSDVAGWPDWLAAWQEVLAA